MDVAKLEFISGMCDHCQRYELFNMINDALLLVDANDGDILFMNQRALDLYQYSKEEVLQLTIMSLNNEAGETVRKRMKKVSHYDKGYIFTVNHVKKDGTVFKVEVSSRYMLMHGRHIMASIVRDLTVDSKMREEVEIAGKVQRRLLPRDLETDLFRMRSVYQPLNYLSGDLYDIAFKEDKQILSGIIIDVMGHGVAAANQSNILKYLFHQAIEKHIPINDKLAWINNEVMPFFTGGGFAAALLFELDFKWKVLTYAAAGINQFLFVDGAGPAVKKAPGLFLGINENEQYDQGVIQFHSGDSFFFLTDGLFELLPQPIGADLDFWKIHGLCKQLAVSTVLRDDASAVGILIR